MNSHLVHSKSKERLSDGSLNGHDVEHGTVSTGKVMNDPPTTVWNVHHVRNTGSPKRGDSHGDGVLVVVSGKESLLQGEGEQVETGKVSEAGEMPFALTEVPRVGWRAGYAERCPSGSERGVWKRAAR